MDLVMHVTANGDLTQAVLNAIAILLNSDTFKTAIKISIVFAILGTGVSYIAGRDITVFAKWFIVYFLVAIIMLHPMKRNLRIIDSSNPFRSDLTVGNIPYGLAIPAHFITTFSHGLTEAFEAAFHMPDEFNYNKTGMLFGSRLFRLSTEINITSPELKSELNQYIKNCIIPDVNILKSYNMGDISKNTNLSSVIFNEDGTSNTRGIYMYERTETTDLLGTKGYSITGQKFCTCKIAAKLLSKYIAAEFKSSGFQNYARSLFTSKKITSSEAAQKFLAGIGAAYQELNYSSLSGHGLNIATQNLLINAVRDGLKAYSAEANDTAGLLNLSTTQAMDRMRMNLATSRNMASYTIPVIHTALLLMMLGLFPVIILLAFQPSMFARIIKNYFYTLIWLESWPLMFACLNIITTFYIKSRTGAIGASGLTMANIDLLALEHSDIANMAGYLMILIPFISGGLVYGMSSVFTSAASYIGGVLQSSATASASEAATGNIHLGNASWGNVNANKLDTNYSVRGGMSTKQLRSGVTETTAADGTPIVDSTAATSRLSTNIKFDELLSDSLSKQHREATTAGEQAQRSFDKTASSALNQLDQFGKSMENRRNVGDDVALKDAISYAQDYNNMVGVAKHLSEKTGTSQQDSLRRLTEAFAGADASAGASIGAFAKVEGRVGTRGATSSEAMANYLKAHDINLSTEDVKKFGESYNHIKSFDASKHAGQMDADTYQILANTSADLRKAENYSEQKNRYFAQSESAERAKAFTQQHSSQINSDLSQPFVEYLRKQIGADESNRLLAGRAVGDHMKLRSYAQEFVASTDFTSQFVNVPTMVDVKSRYKLLEDRTPYLEEQYNINQKALQNTAYQGRILSEDAFNKKYQNIIDQETAGRNLLDGSMRSKVTDGKSEHSKLEKEIVAKQTEGQHGAQQSVTQSLTKQAIDSPQWFGSFAKDLLNAPIEVGTSIKEGINNKRASVETIKKDE